MKPPPTSPQGIHKINVPGTVTDEETGAKRILEVGLKILT